MNRFGYVEFYNCMLYINRFIDEVWNDLTISAPCVNNKTEAQWMVFINPKHSDPGDLLSMVLSNVDQNPK